MAGDTLETRWKDDKNPVSCTKAADASQRSTFEALVPFNTNGDMPEDIQAAERSIVIEWASASSDRSRRLVAYMKYIATGSAPSVTFSPDIDLAPFLK